MIAFGNDNDTLEASDDGLRDSNKETTPHEQSSETDSVHRSGSEDHKNKTITLHKYAIT